MTTYLEDTLCAVFMIPETICTMGAKSEITLATGPRIASPVCYVSLLQGFTNAPSSFLVPLR